MPSVGWELSITKLRRIALKAQTVLTSARSLGRVFRLEMETICGQLVLKLLPANYIELLIQIYGLNLVISVHWCRHNLFLQACCACEDDRQIFQLMFFGLSLWSCSWMTADDFHVGAVGALFFFFPLAGEIRFLTVLAFATWSPWNFQLGRLSFRCGCDLSVGIFKSSHTEAAGTKTCWYQSTQCKWFCLASRQPSLTVGHF